MFLKTMIKRVMAKVFYRTVPVFTAIAKEYELSEIRRDPNIKLGEKVKIGRGAKIETRYGGSIKIGDRVILFDGVLILSDGGSIEIGNNCQINPYSVIYGSGKGTRIGNNVLIAAHCVVIPTNHNFGNRTETIMNQGGTSKGINIEDDVWISHGCSILDGITIGRGSVIAAGAVVNRSVPPCSVYGGVPAKHIKDR